MKLVLTCALSSVLLIQGCAAAAIGSYAYNSVGKAEARQKYLSEFNKTNIEREKNGLKPLDACQAKRDFDKDWADEDTACKK